MAEVVGIVANIAQVAGTGTRLNADLCDLAGRVGRAGEEIVDFAHDVETTAIGLEAVGKLIGQENPPYEVSRNAISEAGSLAERCEILFGEIHDVMEKRWKLDEDGKSLLIASGKLEEQRFELLTRKLDCLKHTVVLLQHVLQLADGQAKGNIDDKALAQEREAIRDLHQSQQDATESLLALENKVVGASNSRDGMLNGSGTPSRVPSINFLVNSSTSGASLERRTPGTDMSMAQMPSAVTGGSETSDSDDTVTDDDSDHLTVDDLDQYAHHAQDLLNKIMFLRQYYDTRNSQSHRHISRNRVVKYYRRFCRKFESSLAVPTCSTSESARQSAILSPSQRYRHVQTLDSANESQLYGQHPSRISSFPSGIDTEGALLQSQDPKISGSATRPAAEANFLTGAPSWTISSEPLGPGSRPKLPPLMSTIPHAIARQASPLDDTLSPVDGHNIKHSGPDGDADQGSHEPGPVVYTKTGRISKAKKGLKVHCCEVCGRSFTRAEHLRRHQKNHGPNQVRCELCGKVFFRADLLQRHLERHKDVPQGYRFGNNALSTAEDESPLVGDEQLHRHILPAIGASASTVPPHHSPGGRSVESSGASGAGTPSDRVAVSPALAQPPRSTWDTSNASPTISYVPEDKAPPRQHAWQSVNAQERKQEPSELAQPHNQSPLQESLHPGRPKLLPKVDLVNTTSTQKRFSNILPAPGAPNVPQYTAYPQGHTPNMLPHQDLRAQGPEFPTRVSEKPQNQNGRILPWSPKTTSNTTGTGLSLQAKQGTHQFPVQSSPASALRSSPGDSVQGLSSWKTGEESFEKPSGIKLSSNTDGVPWRVAETDSRPYEKITRQATSPVDGNQSRAENIANEHTPHHNLGANDGSQLGSRSLSLVTPQDERDRALVARIRHEHISSPHGGPSPRTLSPALAEKKSSSRPSTGVSDSGLRTQPTVPGNLRISTATSIADRLESPRASDTPLDPESPYSLATINRYIQNQGPQPGMNQSEDPAPPSGQVLRTQQPNDPASLEAGKSIAPCERCREYSIKCDGILPSCTACATTKYASKCSFANLPVPSSIPPALSQGPHRPQESYENISAMTRHAMAEPHDRTKPPPSDQDYGADDDLPSPYLKPRDKTHQHIAATTRIPDSPLDSAQDHQPAAGAQSSRKRKADSAQRDASKPLERKKTKGSHAKEASKRSSGGGAAANSKDIVDLLLKEWTVPVP